METTPYITVIIPVHNSAATIGACLSALSGSTYRDFEVIVADDCSNDDTLVRARQAFEAGLPGRIIELQQHAGAAEARNTGARHAQGEVLFFIDSDCVVNPDTLQQAAQAYRDSTDMKVILGGTYTPLAHDRASFFSSFQSAFIHYSETKSPVPDYIATHAMIMQRSAFLESGGFLRDEHFMPILEDVEYSHRMRSQGYTLQMVKGLEVEHIFHFTLARSLRNAFRKTRYWIAYSLEKRDMHQDSGTASVDLKVNGVLWLLSALCLASAPWTDSTFALRSALELQVVNLLIQLRFLQLCQRAGGMGFALKSMLYYMLLYPAPIWAGTLSALFIRRKRMT